MYEKISNIIEDYLNTPNTDYAILLNGEWGCGKTYYVEHELSEALRRNHSSLIHISLHGVRNYDEVSTQLVLSRIGTETSGQGANIRFSYQVARVLREFNEASSFFMRFLWRIVF